MRKCRLTPGDSLDLVNGWDLSKPGDQAEVTRIILENKPTPVVGSPPCTMMCVPQIIAKAWFGNGIGWMKRFEAKLKQAKEHVRHCCNIYRIPMEAGRDYLHEHPWSARSWQINEVVDLCEDPRTTVVRARQCQFGWTVPLGGPKGKAAPVKKPTGFMTNAWAIAQLSNNTCLGGHTHAWLDTGRAKNAAVYPRQLCEAVCRGLEKHTIHGKEYKTTCFTTTAQDHIRNEDANTALRRLVRHLLGCPRLVWHFRFQEVTNTTNTFADTDFAGCLSTRGSTSGGAAMRGTHLIRHWSTTQGTVTLSSAKAESNGICKGASTSIGLRSVALDLGMSWDITLKTDATAAIGITRRRGLGKIRHLATADLWVQDHLRAGDFKLQIASDNEHMSIYSQSMWTDPTLYKT